MIQQEEDSFDISKIEREKQLQSSFPPFNQSATVISDVYNVTDLIEQHLLDRLTNESIEILNTDLKNIPYVFRFFF